jgi:ADP-ribose pyrophosphatase YjhB (NUDIX family)
MNPQISRHSHCHFCGHRYDSEQPWPKLCRACGQTTYRNPLPVAVAVVPITNRGVLLVRRAIEPRLGQLALPGGFIDHGEAWQQALCREVLEETGLVVSVETVDHFATLSASDGTVLIFGQTEALPVSALETIKLSEETSECVVAAEPMPLAFPLHTYVLAQYFLEQYIDKI